MSRHPIILVAEDDFEDRFIMNQTFDELGYGNVLKIVEDGPTLIDYLNNNRSEIITLIILDLNMPKMSGTDTLRVLKENDHFKDIPVIIFSTSINKIQADVCMQLGAKEYITKSAKYSEYVETCKRFYAMAQL